MSGFYGDDLAKIHFEGHSAFIDGVIPYLLETLLGLQLPGSTVVDLGCGAGQWLKAASAVGHTAWGIDASRAMIELASKQCPAAELSVGSIYDNELPNASMITALGEVLSYMNDDEPPVFEKLIQKVHNALKPGGVFLFDVMVQGEPTLTGRHWREEDDWALMVAADEQAERNRVVRDIITFCKHDDSYRRAEERHVQYLYDQIEVDSILMGSGFDVEAMMAYGLYTLMPRRIAFKAIKT